MPILIPCYEEAIAPPADMPILKPEVVYHIVKGLANGKRIFFSNTDKISIHFASSIKLKKKLNWSWYHQK